MINQDRLAGFRYNAFISYNRRDKAFAAALEKALEKYHPPRGLDVPQRRLNVFRDEGDLVGSEYFESIERHLGEAEKLIVLCTPSARQSDYVNDEIRRFSTVRGKQQIIPLLLDGVPNNVAEEGEEEEMAFPKSLCDLLKMPLAIDFTHCTPSRGGITRHLEKGPWYSLLAGIYGKERAEVEQRENRRQRIRWTMILSAALSLSLVLGGLAVYAFQKKREADESLAQSQASHRRTIASRFALTAERQLDKDPQLALLLAAEAVQVTKRLGEPTVDQAKVSLANLLGRAAARPLVNAPEGAEFAAFSPDGNSALFVAGGELTLLTINPLGLTEHRQVLPWPGESRGLRVFGPFGRYLVLESAGADRGDAKSHILDMRANTLTGLDVRPIGLGRGGRWLVVLDPDRIVRIVDTESLPAALPGIEVGRHRGEPRDVNVSPNGRWLAFLGEALRPMVLDLDAFTGDGALPLQVLERSSNIHFLHFSGNSRWLTAADTDQSLSASGARVDLWRFEDQDRNWRVVDDKADFFQRGVALLENSPRQNWLGIVGWQAGEDGDNDRWVSLWHLGDSDYHQRLPLRKEVSDLEFSADDLWVAAASRYDPLVRVWDLTDFSESKRDQRPLRMHLEFKVAGRGVNDLQFLKSRNALLVRDGASRVWNLESREAPDRPFNFLGKTVDGAKLVLSPDRDWMISIHQLDRPWLWMFEKPKNAGELVSPNEPEEKLLALAAQVAGRNMTKDEWLHFYADSEYRLNPRQTFENFQLLHEQAPTGKN